MDTPTTTPIDLGAIEAALLDALEAVDRRAEINRRLSTCSGPEFDAAMDAERVACDAWFASLTAWREAGYPRAIAAARVDGARVMQADAAGILDAEARRMQDAADALLAEDGDVTDIEKNHRLNSNAIMCRMAAGKIRALDPAAVVGSPEPALAECPGCEGSGSVSPSGCIRCPACEGSGTVPAAVVGSGS